MSIVTWDGKLLVCDRMGVNNGMQTEERKCKVFTAELGTGTVVAWTGPLGKGLAMAHWYSEGEIHGTFPACQADRDRWARLIVAHKNRIYYYEQVPFKLEVIGRYMAWGAGRDFAMGAFHQGANAAQAAEAACQFSDSCGMGLDVFNLSEIL